MALVAAKCTNCGAALQVDNTKDAAICQHCGSAFIVEKAINHYHISNTITADTVNVYTAAADFVIRAGVLEKYNGAETDVVIPAGVKSIGAKAFEGCIGLTSVVIPEGVTEIRRGCFSGCSNLRTVKLPESLCKLEEDFAGCTSLEELDAIEALARERNLRVSCMFTMRFEKKIRALKALVESGALGEVNNVYFGGQHPLQYGRRPMWYFEKGRHEMSRQRRDHAGHQCGIMHDTHAHHFQREDSGSQRRTKQCRKTGTHAAHNDGSLAVAAETIELAQPLGDTAAQLQRCAFPTGRATHQLGNGSGNKDQRCHLKGDISRFLDGRHHCIGTLIAGIAEATVQRYDQQTADRQKVNHKRILRPQVIHKYQRMTEQ